MGKVNIFMKIKKCRPLGCIIAPTNWVSNIPHPNGPNVIKYIGFLFDFNNIICTAYYAVK